MASRPCERARGGRRVGGAGVGFGFGFGAAGAGVAGAAGAWPAEGEVRERVAGGFSRTSSSLLMVYHRRTAEAEKVWRWPTLLKKDGGGLWTRRCRLPLAADSAPGRHWCWCLVLLFALYSVRMIERRSSSDRLGAEEDSAGNHSTG